LTKPVQGTVLLEAIHEALQKDANGLAARMERGRLERRLDMLTPREREILPLVISGLMIKAIADRISTSEITAKVHKRRIMMKLG